VKTRSPLQREPTRRRRQVLLQLYCCDCRWLIIEREAKNVASIDPSVIQYEVCTCEHMFKNDCFVLHGKPWPGIENLNIGP